MAFIESPRFPDDIAYGTRGGPFIDVSVVVGDAGADYRVKRGIPQREYDAAYGIKTHQQLYNMLEYFIARDGAATGFRFKDFSDFSSASDGKSAPTITDVELGSGDGSTTQFQLIKFYEPGAYQKTRVIEKPVSGTVLVEVNGVAQTLGVDFTVDTSTGIITFTSAPTSGHIIKVGFEFDVPVQFGPELGRQALQASLDDFSTGSIPSIPLKEMNQKVAQPERFYHGGGTTRTLIGDEHYSFDHGLFVVYAPGATRKIYMPNPLDLPQGINYPVLFNNAAGGSGFDLNLRKFDDSGLIFTIPPQTGAELFIFELGGNNTWGGMRHV